MCEVITDLQVLDDLSSPVDYWFERVLIEVDLQTCLVALLSRWFKRTAELFIEVPFLELSHTLLWLFLPSFFDSKLFLPSA
ncbi:Signal peptide peptidase-like 2 [Camellia lanceoleosa]|uniref:Signal peptide peptidase-like 2 n=1 Tax=Camellia lanceoleosa TaxID=1840588 RepID=A0ACC0FKT8_9ERIC|nr:Signal peptide peptidase-like 2 [Camellia lanceoleosa]